MRLKLWNTKPTPALRLNEGARAGTSAAILGFPENGSYDVQPGRLGQTSTVATQDAYGISEDDGLAFSFGPPVGADDEGDIGSGLPDNGHAETPPGTGPNGSSRA